MGKRRSQKVQEWTKIQPSSTALSERKVGATVAVGTTLITVDFQLSGSIEGAWARVAGKTVNQEFIDNGALSER